MKQFAVTFSIWLALAFALHALVTFVIAPPRIDELLRPRQAERLEAVLTGLEQGAEVLSLVGSTEFFTDPEDLDERPISEMLSERLGDARVVVFTDGAFHLGIFRAFVDYLGRRPEIPRPELLLVDVSLRSFSTSWFRKPNWQYLDLIRFLEWDGPAYRFAFRPLATFKFFRSSDLTLAEFAELPVRDGDEIVGRVEDFQGPWAGLEADENTVMTDAQMRDMIIYYYMEPLAPDHPRLLDLVRLAQRADELGIATIFYSGPIDFETCKEFYGPGFLPRVYQNLDVVRGVLRAEGHELLDLTFELEPDAFHYYGAPNEHLSERGRAFVARALERAIVERRGDGG